MMQGQKTGTLFAYDGRELSMFKMLMKLGIGRLQIERVQDPWGGEKGGLKHSGAGMD